MLHVTVCNLDTCQYELTGGEQMCWEFFPCVYKGIETIQSLYAGNAFF